MKYGTVSGRDLEWIRLYQFLDERTKDQLLETIAKVTATLQISRTKEDFAEHLAVMMGGGFQTKIEELLVDNFSAT
jgi:hypothetical protein